MVFVVVFGFSFYALPALRRAFAVYDEQVSNVVENYETQFVTFIESEMEQDLAYDLNHVFRVVKTSKLLSKIEGAMLEVVLPAAYLHDCFHFPRIILIKVKALVLQQIRHWSFLMRLVIRTNITTL